MMPRPVPSAHEAERGLRRLEQTERRSWLSRQQSITDLAGLPDVEQVVVAAGRELAARGAPLEAAHLLLVPRQPLLHVVPLPACEAML